MDVLHSLQPRKGLEVEAVEVSGALNLFIHGLMVMVMVSAAHQMHSSYLRIHHCNATVMCATGKMTHISASMQAPRPQAERKGLLLKVLLIVLTDHHQMAF